MYPSRTTIDGAAIRDGPQFGCPVDDRLVPGKSPLARFGFFRGEVAGIRPLVPRSHRELDAKSLGMEPQSFRIKADIVPQGNLEEPQAEALNRVEDRQEIGKASCRERVFRAVKRKGETV